MGTQVFTSSGSFNPGANGLSGGQTVTFALFGGGNPGSNGGSGGAQGGNGGAGEIGGYYI